MSETPVRIDNPESAPAAGAYAPALVFRDLVFVSGQGPLDRDGNIVSGTIEEETSGRYATSRPCWWLPAATSATC